MLTFLSKVFLSHVDLETKSRRQRIESLTFLFLGACLMASVLSLSFYFGKKSLLEAFDSPWFLVISTIAIFCACFLNVLLSRKNLKEAEEQAKRMQDNYDTRSDTVRQLSASEKERNVLRIVLSYTITQNLDELYSQFALNMEIVPELRALGLVGLIDSLKQMLEADIKLAKEKTVSRVESTEVMLLKAKKNYDKLVSLRENFRVEKQGFGM